jgi:hypothetical protein
MSVRATFNHRNVIRRAALAHILFRFTPYPLATVPGDHRLSERRRTIDRRVRKHSDECSQLVLVRPRRPQASCVRGRSGRNRIGEVRDASEVAARDRRQNLLPQSRDVDDGADSSPAHKLAVLEVRDPGTVEGPPVRILRSESSQLVQNRIARPDQVRVRLRHDSVQGQCRGIAVKQSGTINRIGKREHLVGCVEAFPQRCGLLRERANLRPVAVFRRLAQFARETRKTHLIAAESPVLLLRTHLRQQLFGAT